MLITSSIEETRVLVLKVAGDRAQAFFSNLQRQMRLALGDVACVQPRTLLSQSLPEYFQCSLELSVACDNSPIRYAVQSDVVPAKRNRRQTCETRHHCLLLSSATRTPLESQS